MNDQRRAYGYALGAVLMWATAASAFKLSLDHIDFIELLFFSSFTAWVILFVIILLQGKLEEVRSCSRTDLLNSAKLGFLNPFLYYLVLFKAYSLLPAQEAQPLNFTWPIMLAILSVPILNQKMSPASIVALVVSFSGVMVISTRGDIAGFRFTNPLGAGLALGSSVIWAMFWLQNMKDGRDEVCKLFLNFLFGFLFISIPFLLFTDLTRPSLWGPAGGIYIGLFEMGLTFVLWMRALRYSTRTSHVANIIYATPFASLLVISFVVGETIRAPTVIGLVLIVAGILLQQSSRSDPGSA